MLIGIESAERIDHCRTMSHRLPVQPTNPNLILKLIPEKKL